MKSIAVLALLAVLAYVSAQAQQNDKCRTSKIIFNIAEHHFHNTQVTDQAAFQALLVRECNHLGHFEGQWIATDCLNTVNDNIAKIYSDLTSGTPITQTC